MEITKSFEYSGLLTKGATRTIENETKEKQRWILWYVIKYSRCELIRKHVSK